MVRLLRKKSRPIVIQVTKDAPSLKVNLNEIWSWRWKVTQGVMSGNWVLQQTGKQR
jgi:hypothetical protein